MLNNYLRVAFRNLLRNGSYAYINPEDKTSDFGSNRYSG